MKIGASILGGYLRHVYDSVQADWRGRGAAPHISNLEAGRAAIVAAAQVCTGMTDDQIVRVASGIGSIVGWHPLGMTYVEIDVPYNAEIHDGGPIRLIEGGGKS